MRKALARAIRELKPEEFFVPVAFRVRRR